MRKNSGDRKGVKGVFVCCEVTGLNLDGLINRLKREGITLFDLKKISNKRLIIKVKLQEYEKFFAIVDKMCYNVRRIRYTGWGYPLYFLFSSIGLLVGALVFLIGTAIADGFIFSIDFVGSGRVKEREIREILYGMGVKEYSRFASFDLASIEDAVLAKSQNLSFVSMKKSGNRLIVDSALSAERVEISNGKVNKLCSSYDGEIESIKVYRGEAVVKEGDMVNAGDLLVKGRVAIKDVEVETGVLAVVTVLTQEQYYYRSKNDNEETLAEAFALLSSGEECLSSVVDKTFDGESFLYTVTLKYRRIIYAG